MRLAAILSVLALSADSALAQAEKVAATLTGHAVLPAQTFVAPPADAPEAFRAAGRFAGPGNVRAQVRGPVAGAAGLKLPFDGQPVQAFPASSISATASTGRCRTTALAARRIRQT